MIPLESWLTKLEHHLQSLVEGAAARLLADRNGRHEEQAQEVPLDYTARYNLETPKAPREATPLAAFLVVDGVRLFPLDKSVVNIGRAPENDLVIDDLRVSRQHIQLRVVNGRYVLFDLGSTGGTRLNGSPIVQHHLSPGDVILLAGVPVVYGQDGNQGTDHTQELTVQG